MAKRDIQIIINFFFVFGFVAVAYGQQSTIQVEKNRIDSLRGDFRIFRNRLQNDYPSLYRYSSKIKMNALFDSCYTSIRSSTTDIDFYKMLKILLSDIKDGHLYCSSPPYFQSHYQEKANFFPLQLRFINHRAYLLNSYKNKIPAGTEILSINNQPIDFIRQKLFLYLTSDGNIETKKYQILNNFFYFYYYLEFGEQAIFNVNFKSESRKINTIKINADLEKNIIKNEDKVEPEKLLELSIKPNNIAIITIKTFESSKLKKDFPSFLQTSFKELNNRKIKRLIIDLRGNAGGKDTYGSLLYSYLTNKPFHYYQSLETATTLLPYEQFKSDVSSYNNLNIGMIEKISEKRFRLKKEAHPNLQLIKPARYYFAGKICFLIDGLSFSTTTEFCSIAYSNKRGKFIGEETGGTYVGNTSGVDVETILPSTKINLSYGTVKYSMAVKQEKYKGRGVIPNYKVRPTINNIINHQDVVLDYALKLIVQK